MRKTCLNEKLVFILRPLIKDKTRGIKSMDKKRKRSAKMAARVQNTAELTGFSTDYVYAVISGERDNEEIMITYMFLYEEENKLLKAAKELVPMA